MLGELVPEVLFYLVCRILLSHRVLFQKTSTITTYFAPPYYHNQSPTISGPSLSHGVTYSRSIEKGVMSAVYTTHSIPVASWAIALLGLLLHIPTCTTEHLPLFFKNLFMTMYNQCLPFICMYLQLC